MVSVVPLAHDMFRGVLDRSVTVPNRSETHPPALGTIRSLREQVHTPVLVLPCLARVLPHSSHPWRAFLICLISGLFRDLAWDPSLASHLCTPSLLMLRSDQTIFYPRDPRVIAPSRSSSLRTTTSMTDLREEFECALRRAKDARPVLRSVLGLAGAIIGDCYCMYLTDNRARYHCYTPGVDRTGGSSAASMDTSVTTNRPNRPDAG